MAPQDAPAKQSHHVAGLPEPGASSKSARRSRGHDSETRPSEGRREPAGARVDLHERPNSLRCARCVHWRRAL
eukprot:838424-Pyramimonas_sp.AAC.1